MAKNLRVKIGGSAGQGIKSAGLIFSKFMSRSGYYIYNYTEYPSLIKGGHNMMQINVSNEMIYAPSLFSDILIALNQETVYKHKNFMSENSIIIVDEKSHLNTDHLPEKVRSLPVPLSKISKEAGGSDMFINTVALGFIVKILNLNLQTMKNVVKEEYGDGDLEVKNEKALDLGFMYAETNFPNEIGTHFSIEPLNHEQRLVINGDEAVAIGAIRSGMKLASIYPMTPISNLMQTLIKFQKENKFIFKQPEDEISAINIAIGASFAGVRSMTATSGGGFCLMTEAFGLAGMTETPLVIVEGMRGGPATGLPTWNSQGDLMFILNAHQDEFPRIVLSAGDNIEALLLTMEAFHLADKYQTPVVLILDKNICEHEMTVPILPILTDENLSKIDRGKLTTSKVENFKRYSSSEDGVSMRTIPGSGNFMIANSDEHDEMGFSCETSENRILQMNKRMKKMETVKKDMPNIKLIGHPNAELTVVSWGSNKGSILEAMKVSEKINFLHLTWMNPFPSEEVSKILKNSKKTLLVEANYSGQLGNLIRQKTGIEISDKLLKYDGRPFFIEELQSEFLKRLGGSI
jgi:2-oxoglutarate ferredoxin oxidoreductase subunit alpha